MTTEDAKELSPPDIDPGQIPHTRLDAALHYAAKGWPVFPCRPNAKVPLGGKGVHDATTDADQIRKWWEANPDCNIGFHVGAANLMAVDYDCDDEAVDEFATLHDLDETLSVITPNGCHEYYRTDKTIPPSVGKVADKIDIRSDGSYTLLPPSAVPEGSYKWSYHPIAKATDSLIKAATAGAREKADNPKEINVEEDKPENVQRYIDWLKSKAKVPERGQRNNMLASTAATGHSFAVSTDKTVELIKEHWNPRLNEPLDDDEIDISGTSGHRSASSAQGNMTAEYLGKQKAEASKAEFQKRGDTQPSDILHGGFRLSVGDSIDHIQPASFLIGRSFVQRSTAMLFGAAGSMKTFLMLDVGLSIASGMETWPITGDPISPSSRQVVYVAGEGRSSFPKRKQAWQEHRQASAGDNFTLVDPIPKVADGYEDFADVIEAEVGAQVDLIVLDTLARTMEGLNETDDASRLVAAMDYLRDRFSACVVVIHHSGWDTTRERGSSVYRGAIDTLFRLKDNELDILKQKDDEALTPLAVLEHEKVLDSLVLKSGTPLGTKAVQAVRQKRTSKSEKDAARIEAQAWQYEPLALALVKQKAPAGAHKGKEQMADWLAEQYYDESLSSLPPKTSNMWKKYLRIFLDSQESALKKLHYDERQGQWILNRPGDRNNVIPIHAEQSQPDTGADFSKVFDPVH